ncbi:capsular polysaccharide synthesis protein [Actibacterium sp. 188UL27-1]|uniref:capsular polysaccharide synthesis protein n=1 Tax=Actibacterium sp. 188UL27-1 TaxID=2786961 RepID=UPI00195D7049|nr:capsular polysaccharide synthesis protein [Actibacterium sp. 188UL27-1]MBM7069620.1 hypothetical protein [Actibacterium sp. 188UL27-1]
MKIWSMWDAGRANAPDMLQRCFTLWETLNPTHKLNVIERAEMEDRLADLQIDPHANRPNVNANILRLALLRDVGGCWVDATLVPFRPLDDWFTGQLDTNGFFAFSRPGDDRPVANWFLASPPGHVIAQTWLDRYAALFRHNRQQLPPYRSFKAFRAARKAKTDRLWFVRPGPGRLAKYYPYFMMHYQFDQLLQSDTDFANAWEATPKVSALPSLLTIHVCRTCQTVEEFEQQLPELLDASPVHKVDRRRPECLRIVEYAEERCLSNGG